MSIYLWQDFPLYRNSENLTSSHVLAETYLVTVNYSALTYAIECSYFWFFFLLMTPVCLKWKNVNVYKVFLHEKFWINNCRFGSIWSVNCCFQYQRWHADTLGLHADLWLTFFFFCKTEPPLFRLDSRETKMQTTIIIESTHSSKENIPGYLKRHNQLRVMMGFFLFIYFF